MTLRYFSLLPLLLSMGLTSAADVAIPLVLPESTALRWLTNDPALVSADNALAAANIEANQQALSPYDWVANGTYQRRDTGTGSNSNEWNVGLERTFRLPNKVKADEAVPRPFVQNINKLAVKRQKHCLMRGLTGWLPMRVKRYC